MCVLMTFVALNVQCCPIKVKILYLCLYNVSRRYINHFHYHLYHHDDNKDDYQCKDAEEDDINYTDYDEEERRRRIIMINGK